MVQSIRTFYICRQLDWLIFSPWEVYKNLIPQKQSLFTDLFNFGMETLAASTVTCTHDPCHKTMADVYMNWVFFLLLLHFFFFRKDPEADHLHEAHINNRFTCLSKKPIVFVAVTILFIGTVFIPVNSQGT